MALTINLDGLTASQLAKAEKFEEKVEAGKKASFKVGTQKLSYKPSQGAETVSFIKGGVTSATFDAATAPTPAPTPAPTTAPTTFSLAVGSSIVTEGSTATFTVTRTGSTASAVTLIYNVTGDTSGGAVAAAVPGADTGSAAGTVTIAAGSNTATFTVAANSDSAIEGLEGIKVTLFDSNLAVVASRTAVINDDTSAVPAQNFTLTVGLDVRSGGAGSDTFDGATNSNNGAVATINAFDAINGGAGNDLIIANQGAIADVTFSGLTSIEQLVTVAGTTLGTQAQRAGINSVTTSGTGGLTLAAGYTNDAVSFQAAAGNIDVVDFQNKAASTNLRVTFTSSEVGNSSVLDGTATSPQDGGLAVRVQSEDGSDGLTGGVSRFDDEGTVFRSTTDTTIRFDVRDISGTARGTFQEVHLGTVAADTVTAAAGVSTYVNGGSGNDAITGDTAADFLVGGVGDDTIATGNGNNSVIGGSGNDSITVGTGNDSVDGGAGNDTFTFAANFTAADTIAGGADTDTLTVNAAIGTGGDALFANVTGIENLVLAGTAAASNTLGTNAQAAGVISVDNSAATAASTLSATAYTVGLSVTMGPLSDSIATGSGNDVFIGSSNNIFDGGETISAGAGTDTIRVTGASATATLDFDDMTGIEQVVLAGTTGGDAVTVSLDAVGTVTATQTVSIDASAFTGASDALTVTVTASTTTSNTSYSITGGAGNDVLAGDVRNDTLIGGAGNDSITAGAGNDSLSGGAGNDTFTLAANLSSADTISGGDNTDTLAVDALGTGGDAAFTNVTSVENLTLGSGSSTIGALAQAAGVTAVSLAAAGGNSTLAASGFTVGLAVTLGANTDTVTTGTGNDTFSGSDGVFAAADSIVAGAGTDAIRITGASSTAILDFDNITGLEQVVAVGTTGSDAVTVTFAAITSTVSQTISVDGTALTGASDTLTASANAVVAGGTAFSITGGAGNDSLVGGVNADTVAGGAGTDTLVGNAGNDSLDGGDGNDSVSADAGNDTVSGGAGTDTISGGEGSDRLTGGAAADRFVLGAEASILVYDTITDLSLSDDDVLVFTDGTDTEAFATAAITLGGVATFQNYLDTATASTSADGAVSFFQFGGNTYVVQNNDAAAVFTSGSDIVVEISGLVNLSGATLAADATLTV